MKYISIIIVLIFFSSCTKEKEKEMADNKKDTIVLPLDLSLKNFYESDELLSLYVDKYIVPGLTEEELIAQLIISSSGKYGKSEGHVYDLIKNKKIGGVILLGGSKESFSSLISNSNDTAKKFGSLPLLFSTDAEPGLINIKITGIKEFKPAAEINSEEESYSVAGEISLILKEIGFQQNFAPVCDFPYNKDIIGNRSFGKSEQNLISLSNEFIRSTQNNNLIATAKHFPGHGNVKGDSHKELVFIDGELKELNVFREVIRGGVISVMVGHIAIRNNDKYSTEGMPSTLSKKIVNGLLKNELGFKGLVITDAMNMSAVSKFANADLEAFKAGCDMILMPENEKKLSDDIKQLISNDSKYKEQLYSSAKKILKAKLCLGLIR